MKDTFIPSENSIETTWHIIDASEQPLGRLATQVATYLSGKNKIFYTPYQQMNNYIIIINADKVKVTGKKYVQKIYMRHSGRPGGKTVETFEQLQKRIPERIIEKAIKGMLPKTRLGRKLFTKLKVYAGSQHPHSQQNIITIKP